MEELLRILEKNARMPIEDIAAMLDKTPEEIAAMMDEAAAKGYIRGYETLVDWEQAGVNLVEAVIELRVTPHKARGFDDIGMTIAQFDEVDTVLLMSGSYDLQVIIKGRSFQEIAIFVAKRLSPLQPWKWLPVPPPALCCAPTSVAAGCIWPKNPMKESVPSCDELR